MQLAPEQRLYGTRLRLADAQAVGIGTKATYLEGRAVPFDTWADLGWFLEQHDAGSFVATTKAGSGRGLPLLLFHDNRSFPIGVSESWKHDGGGLDGVWRLNDGTEAQRAAKAADDGELVGLSIGFQPIRSEWDFVDDWNPAMGPEHMDSVTRLESRLLEVSLTPTPAFADAQVALVRSTLECMTRAEHAPPERPLLVDAYRAELEALRSGPQ
jgi:HK97 family phage prohead protease